MKCMKVSLTMKLNEQIAGVLVRFRDIMGGAPEGSVPKQRVLDLYLAIITSIPN